MVKKKEYHLLDKTKLARGFIVFIIIIAGLYVFGMVGESSGIPTSSGTSLVHIERIIIGVAMIVAFVMAMLILFLFLKFIEGLGSS